MFAKPATWTKLIRERGRRRPRLRLYPAKPKVGVRAQAPNQARYLDVTIDKLLDRSKAPARDKPVQSQVMSLPVHFLLLSAAAAWKILELPRCICICTKPRTASDMSTSRAWP